MSLSFDKIDGENIVRDDKGRIIMRQKQSQVAIARFPDMDNSTKKYVTDTYVELTGRDVNVVTKFLNYETDENSFCS